MGLVETIKQHTFDALAGRTCELSGQPFGPQSDLFSLGVVIYETATGVNPMRGETAMVTMMNIASGVKKPPSALMPALPPAFDAFIALMLAPKPEKRYQSALDIKEALLAASLG